MDARPGRSARHGTSRGGRRGVVAVALFAMSVAGCGQLGSATTRIDAGEAELEQVVADIVETLELEVTRERPFGSRGSCTLVTNAEGASNSFSLGGPQPEVDDVLGRATAVLAAAGYEIIQDDREEEVFGRRDGLRITVLEDGPTGELAIDANTGCRPLPS
jgi:hypothetical protein